MNLNKVSFRVFKVNDCPLYRTGDRFSVSGIAVPMDDEEDSSLVTTMVINNPDHRKNCKILCSDFSRLIIENERADLIPEGVVTCSGCPGRIRLENRLEDFLEEDYPEEDSTGQEGLLLLLQNFPFFRNIDRADLADVVRLFRRRKYAEDELILRRGDRGDYFYVVIAGRVNVLNDAALPIASLTVGDVFGEMSLLSEENASATVQAAVECELLYIDNREFRRVLRKYPTLHSYFTKLLARRLSLANTYRSGDIVSSMGGKLQEIPPEALFQTLNAGRRTGILTISQLSRGTARYSLRQGSIIRASYAGERGRKAFYEIFREKEGIYKFTPGLPPEDFDAPEIGYFMKLLMEGLHRAEDQ
jgi:CRP-like cAMP-binding protein